MGCHFLLQGIFLTQGSIPGLHCGQTLYPLSHQGSQQHAAAATAAKSLQSCPTLCDLTDCSPPGSSVHGILQARILEWVAMSSSRGSSRPRYTGSAQLMCLGWMNEVLSQLRGTSIPLVCPILCPLYLVMASPSLRELHPPLQSH